MTKQNEVSCLQRRCVICPKQKHSNLVKLAKRTNKKTNKQYFCFFFLPAKQQTPPISLTTRPSRFASTSVATVVKKFDQLSTKTPSQSKITETPAKSAPLRYRSPSPSLTRKTQAFMAKERPPRMHNNNNSNNSNGLPPKGVKPKSESFQKAAAFWSNNNNGSSRC